MLRLRCRSTAFVLALVLTLVSTSAAPLAAAAPVAPGAGSWWSALAAAFDGLLGTLGLGDVRTVSAPEGSALEPDGAAPSDPCLPGQMVGCDVDGGDDTLLIELQPEEEGSSPHPKG
ncbi:MAG TPA: hypothetical protein VHM02_08675 [Thermoanaerobaculia bacterium]|nr:hypothetical protein [Thermoanaerobaculia bacterium]